MQSISLLLAIQSFIKNQPLKIYTGSKTYNHQYI